MSQVIALDTETKIQQSSNISFYCYVTLSEAEQIIVEKELYGTNTIEKYRLETLIYAGYGDKSATNEGVYLDRIIVRGFRKDGALRYRDTTFYCNSPAMNKVLSQIPDSYHDHARKAFAEHAIKLQQQLTDLINTGVKIG
jgi:hypothetical protein